MVNWLAGEILENRKQQRNSWLERDSISKCLCSFQLLFLNVVSPHIPENFNSIFLTYLFGAESWLREQNKKYHQLLKLPAAFPFDPANASKYIPEKLNFSLTCIFALWNRYERTRNTHKTTLQRPAAGAFLVPWLPHSHYIVLNYIIIERQTRTSRWCLYTCAISLKPVLYFDGLTLNNM